jgi:hypothetical protein
MTTNTIVRKAIQIERKTVALSNEAGLKAACLFKTEHFETEHFKTEHGECRRLGRSYIRRPKFRMPIQLTCKNSCRVTVARFRDQQPRFGGCVFDRILIDVIALRAFEAAQVKARSMRLDPGQRDRCTTFGTRRGLGLQPKTGTRQIAPSMVVHEHGRSTGGSAKLSVTDRCQCWTVIADRVLLLVESPANSIR